MALNPIIAAVVKAAEDAGAIPAKAEKAEFYNTVKFSLADGSTLRIQVKKAKEDEE